MSPQNRRARYRTGPLMRRGKTYLALGIGYCVASGGSMLGWTAPVARRVLYLDGEMPAETFRQRLAALVAGSDKERPEPRFFEILSADLVDRVNDLWPEDRP